MDINGKIKELCFERGWSIYELSLEAELTQSTITSMLNRGTPPKIETLQSICKAFGITLSQFFMEDEAVEIVTPDESKLINLFRKMPADKQLALLKLLD